MQGDRTLYRTTIENVNEGINDLAGIDIMLIVITIGLVINIYCDKYDNLIDKIQALERLSTDKTQILEKSNNENKKNIHTQRN